MGSQPELVLTLVLSAAFLHAFWNALVKGAEDRTLVLGLVNIGHTIFGLALVLLFLPPAKESWPFLAASTIVHFLYYVFLLLSYRFGDLSQVYPIARGLSPPVVALTAWIVADEILPIGAWIGILLVSSGIGMLVFTRRGGLTNGKAVAAAIITGLTIATYTVIDGLGVRAAQSPLGYIGWLFLLETFSSFYIFYIRREALHATSFKTYWTGIVGGVVSSVAYGMAIYAKSIASLGAVSAIRESSVIIAALIGVIWFGERPWRLRIISACIVAFGVIMLAQAG